MKKELAIQGTVKFLAGLIIVGVLIFLPAGTFNFFGGWLFMGVLFVPMLIMGAVLLAKNPDLLQKRLNSKEKESTQKGVVGLSAVIFLLGFISAGLCKRFGLMMVSSFVSILMTLIFLAGYVMYAEVLRENTYLSRTVEVQQGQKVIDTGLYGIVRHPMYSATVIMFLSMPLILGALISFFIFLLYPVAIAFRIKNEEEVLKQGLAGYTEYTQKVRYRLIPFIW